MPPPLSSPARVSSPPLAELNPNSMGRAQAHIVLQGMDQRLVRSVGAAFRYRESRPLIIEALDAGILSQDELRALVQAAELRNMRTSTLILIIIRSQRD